MRSPVEKGCPQGGVLSPLLWNLVMDKIMGILKEKFPHIMSVAYADDLYIGAKGKFLTVVRDTLVLPLKEVSNWTKTVGLNLKAGKTKAIVHSGTRVFPSPLVVNGEAIEYSTQERYLGVMIDSKLNFAKHFEQKVTKCLNVLYQCKKAIGRTWGLKPLAMKWAYVSFVRPILTYGALVWYPHLTTLKNTAKFSRVQRLGLTAITGCFRSTPTAALEVLLDVPPIDIYCQELACKSYFRLKENGSWSNFRRSPRLLKSVKSHVECVETLWMKNPMLGIPIETLIEETIEAKYFVTSNPGSVEKSGCIHCYSAGFKSQESAGASFYCPDIARDGLNKWLKPLGKYPSSFQADLHALFEAGIYLINAKPFVVNTEVYMHVGCKPLCEVLENKRTHTKALLECKNVLNELSGICKRVVVNYVPFSPGSVTHMMKVTAQEASTVKFLGPEPSLPVSHVWVYDQLKAGTTQLHVQKWTLEKGCLNSKKIIDAPDGTMARYCERLSRVHLGILTQAITGHGVFNEHLNKMKLIPDPTCPFCEEEEEDRDHFLLSCEHFSFLRKRIFGALSLGPEITTVVTPNKLLDFCLGTKRFSRSTVREDQSVVLRISI